MCLKENAEIKWQVLLIKGTVLMPWREKFVAEGGLPCVSDMSKDTAPISSLEVSTVRGSLHWARAISLW